MQLTRYRPSVDSCCASICRVIHGRILGVCSPFAVIPWCALYAASSITVEYRPFKIIPYKYSLSSNNLPVFCIKLTEFFLKICFIFCFVLNNTLPPNLIDEIVFILNYLYIAIAIVCGVDTWNITRESNLNWFTGYLLIGSCLVHRWILGVLCLLGSSVCFIIWSVLNKIILNHLYISIAIVCGVDTWNITRESKLNWFWNLLVTYSLEAAWSIRGSLVFFVCWVIRLFHHLVCSE